MDDHDAQSAIGDDPILVAEIEENDRRPFEVVEGCWGVLFEGWCHGLGFVTCVFSLISAAWAYDTPTTNKIADMCWMLTGVTIMLSGLGVAMRCRSLFEKHKDRRAVRPETRRGGTGSALLNSTAAIGPTIPQDVAMTQRTSHEEPEPWARLEIWILGILAGLSMFYRLNAMIANINSGAETCPPLTAVAGAIDGFSTLATLKLLSQVTDWASVMRKRWTPLYGRKAPLLVRATIGLICWQQIARVIDVIMPGNPCFEEVMSHTMTYIPWAIFFSVSTTAYIDIAVHFLAYAGQTFWFLQKARWGCKTDAFNPEARGNTPQRSPTDPSPTSSSKASTAPRPDKARTQRDTPGPDELETLGEDSDAVTETASFLTGTPKSRGSAGVNHADGGGAQGAPLGEPNGDRSIPPTHPKDADHQARGKSLMQEKWLSVRVVTVVVAGAGLNMLILALGLLYFSKEEVEQQGLRLSIELPEELDSLTDNLMSIAHCIVIIICLISVRLAFRARVESSGTIDIPVVGTGISIEMKERSSLQECCGVSYEAVVITKLLYMIGICAENGLSVDDPTIDPGTVESWLNLAEVIVGILPYVAFLSSIRKVHTNGWYGWFAQAGIVFVISYHLKCAALNFTGYDTVAASHNIYHFFLAVAAGYRLENALLWYRILKTTYVDSNDRTQNAAPDERIRNENPPAASDGVESKRRCPPVANGMEMASRTLRSHPLQTIAGATTPAVRGAGTHGPDFSRESVVGDGVLRMNLNISARRI